MNNAGLPNELLLKVFASISLQDAIQCSLVCRRFNNIIISNFSKFYIESWKPGEAASEPSHSNGIVRNSSDSLTILHENGLDIYEYHPCSRHLYLTVRNVDLKNRTVYAFGKIPRSHLIAYRTRDDDRHLLIYDLSTSRVVLRQEFPFPIKTIICCARTIVLIGSAGRCETVTVALAWIGASLETISAFLNVRSKVARSAEQLAYTGLYDWRRIDFFDCRQGPEIIDFSDPDKSEIPGDLKNRENGEIRGYPHFFDAPNSFQEIVKRMEMGGKSFRLKSHRGEPLAPEIGSIELKAHEIMLAFSDCSRFVATYRRLEPEKLSLSSDSSLNLGLTEKLTLRTDQITTEFVIYDRAGHREPNGMDRLCSTTWGSSNPAMLEDSSSMPVGSSCPCSVYHSFTVSHHKEHYPDISAVFSKGDRFLWFAMKRGCEFTGIYAFDLSAKKLLSYVDFEKLEYTWCVCIRKVSHRYFVQLFDPERATIEMLEFDENSEKWVVMP